MATLKDVARLANVDVSTVSRALNNTSYVHPETKEKIFAAVKELGYHPNVIAKALRQGKRNTIGVVVPRLHLAIFSEILRGIEEAAREKGYCTIICNTDDNPETEAECLDRLRNGFVDGIVIAATGKNGRLIRDIQSGGIPIVQLIRRQEKKISSVVADYEACGYDAVKYLYEKGCREIAIIAGAQHLYPYKGRYEGYSKAIAELNLRENVGECSRQVNTFSYRYDATTQLLSDNYALDGIIAAVDIQGLGAIRAIKDAGLKIPDHIKVISLTGHSVGKMLETSMTSMEMPSRDIGHKTARMIIEQIESNNPISPEHLMFSYNLVEREST